MQTVMSSVVETSVNRTLQFQSGPPRLAEQEHRDMLRSLAVVLTVCFALWLHPKYHKKKAWVAPGRQSPSRTAIVPQKQAIFSVSMPKNKASRTKTAIVTEKPADSSVTMTRNAYRIRNTTPAPPLSYMDSALLSTLRHCLLGKSERNHIHVHSLYVPLRQLELMNQRMSKECTSLIRLMNMPSL